MTKDKALVFVGEDGIEQVWPKHETVDVDGVEIDRNIAGLIRVLWANGIPTLRSCENLRGCIYVSFRTVEDALRGGLLLSDGFLMKITPNSDGGGYPAVSVHIPIDGGSLNVKESPVDVPDDLFRYVSVPMERTRRAYMESGFLEAFYAKDKENLRSAYRRFLDLADGCPCPRCVITCFGGRLDARYL